MGTRSIARKAPVYADCSRNSTRHDEDESQSDNSDDIVKYEIDGVSITRRQFREVEESDEFKADFHRGSRIYSMI
jgi:hypothetical protein